MLSSIYSLWDIGHPLYSYSSIFIIILIIWQMKWGLANGLRFEPKKSSCQHHQKIRQRARNATSRARRLLQEEAEKPWELLSIMKSQSWLPKDRHVRQLLCGDPYCRTCNAALLEIQRLLECESRRISPTSPELPHDSSCLGMPSLSFEQHLEHCPRYSTDISRAPVAPTLTQLSECITQPARAVSIQEGADHLHVGQEFQQAHMPMVPETVASSRLEEPMVPQNKQEKAQSEPKLVQQNQDHCPLKSSISSLSLNSELTHLSHSMASQMDLATYLPLLSPKVRRLLEEHVKKWIHFQKWGLPRRVEESLRQFMPDSTLFCRSNTKQLSSILNNLSDVTTDKTGTISHQTRSSYLAGQPIQTYWVSEWSVIDVDQRNHYHQIQNFKALTLTSQEVEHLSGVYSLSGGQSNGSEISLQKTYSQLFCGLPSLHNESLVATVLGSEGLSKNEYMSKLSLKDPQPLREHSRFPFQPKTPPKSVSASSPTSPSGKAPHEQEGAQISVPFLTLAECEALESHLLHKQFGLQRGLPAIFLRTQHIQSRMQYEACNKAQPPGTGKTSWPGKTFSVLSRKFFFREPARRQLEFHLQRQLIHLRWGLPQRIQQSIRFSLSSTDQQPLTWSCTAPPKASSTQPEEQEPNGTGGLFSAIVDKGSIPTPHLFAQVKEILWSHINSKCGQIHQNKVPAYVQSSWECKIPGDVAGAPYPSIPQDQSLELQAANDHDLHCEVVPWMPVALDHEQQAVPGAATEHCKRPQALSEETTGKLETALQSKNLTFLSGLPAGHHVALSKATSPAAAIQSELTEMVPAPVQVPQEPLTHMSSPDPRERPGPCVQDGSKVHTDTEEELQPEVQVEGMMEEVPVENHTPPACSHLFNTHIMAKLDFHMKKKVLEIQFGIPARAREFKKPTTAKKKSMSLGSQNNQGETVLQKPPIPPDFLAALDAKWVHFKEQLNNELQAVCQNQKQLSSQTTPAGSALWASKQLSRHTTEAQVLCVQVEVSGNNLSLKESWDPGPQGPGKSKHSAHDPTLAEKSEDPVAPKAAGDHGEGDAGLRLLSTSEKRPRVGGQRPEKTLLKNSSFPGGKESEHNMNDSQTKLNVALEPENALPILPQASKAHPFLGHPIQGKLCQGQVAQRPVMPATPHKSPSLPESAWRKKMKSLLHSISPKMKGKEYVESTFSTAGKVARTRKDKVDKSPAPARSLTEKTKTEETRGPKGHTAPTEKPVGPAFLAGTQSSNNKIRLSSPQRGSASVPGYPRHCPRHCPRMACGTQLGSPP